MQNLSDLHMLHYSSSLKNRNQSHLHLGVYISINISKDELKV